MNQNNNTYSSTEGLLLVVDKPVDWTSFDVVNKIRRMSNIRKVGHAGTLDPFATGVLLVCLGPATKTVSQLMELDKEYEATIALGSETDTMDHTGKVTAEMPIPDFSEADIKAVLAGYSGEIDQEIPAYSAAKFRGKRLYKLARSGAEVPQLFKRVRVDSVELLEHSARTLRIRVVCGRGTYIRTLARDIARALGSGGHLSALVRTRIGPYTLDEAHDLEQLRIVFQSREEQSE